MSNVVPGFNGERADPLTGTTPLGNGYRACDPQLMRFHCPDSWSPFGAGGLNAYAWCAGDPVNRADPSGHHSLGGWLGIGVGVALGLLLTPVSGGSSLAVTLSVLAVTTTVASAGLAVAQQCVEASDPQTASALGWGALGMGLLSGLGAVALSRIAPAARSLVSLLKGTGDRPLGGLMMSAGRAADTDVAAGGGQFRHPRFLGVYSDPVVSPGHMMAFSYQDTPGGIARLNIVGQAVMTPKRSFTIGSGAWTGVGYVPVPMGHFRVGNIIHGEMLTWPAIRSVRLLVPEAGGVITSGTGAFYSRVKGMLKSEFNQTVDVSGPKGWLNLAGNAAHALRDLQGSLSIDASGQMVTASGELFSPVAAQGHLDAIAEQYGDVVGAFRGISGRWSS